MSSAPALLFDLGAMDTLTFPTGDKFAAPPIRWDARVVQLETRDDLCGSRRPSYLGPVHRTITIFIDAISRTCSQRVHVLSIA